MELKKQDLIRCAQASLNCYKEKDWFKKRGNKYKKVFDKIKDFSVGDVQGYFGYKGKILYVVFRGTDSDNDWKTNFKCLPITLNVKTKIKVHSGFLMYYKKVKKKIIREAKKYQTIIICGHSQGGGLATLCAENLQFLYPTKDIVCVPLSSPRVGNKYFKDWFDRLIENSYRIWYGNDTIVRLPPWLFGYRHVKKEIHLKCNPWNPLNWITFFTSNPLDHFPDLLLQQIKKQYKDK